jgi:hypothetical protein
VNGAGSRNTEKQANESVKQAALEMAGSVVNWKTANVIIGLLLCVYMGAKWGLQMRLQHENDMYFSAIREVEREISFRTETGLYYSYYKQMVQAPTWMEGMHSLVFDNITEHQRTINIIERFNIHQEIILATIYRLFPWKDLIEPVYFYIDTVFSLYGLYGMTMFLTAWLLSGTWLSGAVTMLFVFFNRGDVTRVWFSIALRESFAFPFIYFQLGLLVLYLKYTHKDMVKRLLLFAICFTTLAFVIAWQFAQFILLLQAFAMYAVRVVGIVPHEKTRNVFLIHVGSLLSVFILQFGNPMVLQSLVLSFNIAALLVFRIQRYKNKTGFFSHLCNAAGYSILTFVLAFALNFLIKFLLNVEADEHIINFVKSKLGLLDPWALRDFDVLLYVCNGSFIFLPFEVIMNLMWTLLLPTYLLALVVCLLLLIVGVIQKWSRSDEQCKGELIDPVMYERPDLSYAVVQTVLYGAMALTTRRFTFLWTPSMCILSGVGVCDSRLWNWVSKKLQLQKAGEVMVQYGIAVVFMGVLLYLYLPPMLATLEELREFWDPDTVELMEWIRYIQITDRQGDRQTKRGTDRQTDRQCRYFNKINNLIFTTVVYCLVFSNSTAPAASFAGSMQLLAGVKLCTGRHITNHPHYENKWLRKRTLQVKLIVLCVIFVNIVGFKGWSNIWAEKA